MPDELRKFYEREYDSLSNAHFQAAQRITTFFQYALIILAAPITIIGLNKGETTVIDYATITWVCLAISLVGFFIVMYIGQLRTEALAYARCINTIRNLFYNEYKQNIEFYNNYIIISSNSKKPKYWDGEQFLFILLSLGILNTLYFYIFINNITNNIEYSFICCALVLILHFIIYYIMTKHSENNMRFYNHTIGIDIDGVLNLHREHFVVVYNKLIDKGEIDGRKISIIDIYTIPVQDAGLILESDANKVFNTTEYWDTMPAIADAGKIITEKLQYGMGYKIQVFTNRQWKPTGKYKKYDIKKNTIKWLVTNRIPAKKVYFEKGKSNKINGINNTLYKNRFYLSAAKKIEYFVEDEPMKARRLANICRYVFLMDHPYNQEADGTPFPYNIIRVKGWDEIYKRLKELLI